MPRSINLQRDPRWGRSQEVPGECPYLTGEYGSYIIRGTQEGEAPEAAEGDSASGRGGGSSGRYLQAASTMKHFQLYDYEGCEPYIHKAIHLSSPTAGAH